MVFLCTYVGENRVCWTIFYILCHFSFGVGTRNLKLGYLVVTSFYHIFRQVVWYILLYSLHKLETKNTTFVVQLTRRLGYVELGSGESWTEMKIRHKDELMQNAMVENLHLSERIQKYVSPM